MSCSKSLKNKGPFILEGVFGVLESGEPLQGVGQELVQKATKLQADYREEQKKPQKEQKTLEVLASKYIVA